MRIVRFRRKHWILTLVLVVLGVSAWGSWLASTGRATDYSQSSSLPFSTSAASGPPTVTDVSRVPMTSSRQAGSIPSASVSMTSMTAPWPMPPTDHVALTGVTDPVSFSRRVARVVLSYDADTDFTARTDRLMTVAALPPIGAPSELAADLAGFRPAADSATNVGSVVFTADSVTPSAWAAGRIDRLHLPSGSFAIDVTGTQTIHTGSGDAIPVSVTIGITGACPPTLVQCEIDRIFPHTVEQELGR